LANRDRKAWSGLRGLKGSRVIAAIRALVSKVRLGLPVVQLLLEKVLRIKIVK
jgi:hypothetical protein